MNSFFKTQFNYLSLIWMCHSRENNRKINRLYGRCLRTICNDTRSSFNELLERDGSVSIHGRNLQFLATEMYKIGNGMSTHLMKEIIPINRIKDKILSFLDLELTRCIMVLKVS